MDDLIEAGDNLDEDGGDDNISILSNDPVDLSYAMLDRYEASGDMAHLDDAVQTMRRAIVLEPQNVDYIAHLSFLLQHRFDRFGRGEDNEECTSLLRTAVDLAPESQYEMPIVLSMLGMALLSRFERIGKLEDLEAAITTRRRAAELTPDGDPQKPGWLSNLGSALQSRYKRVGELEDLDAAILTKREAVKLTPEGDTDNLPAWLNNLGTTLLSRFARVGKLEDLEEAISAVRRAVELTTKEHLDKPLWLNNLGSALRTRFERVGNLDDLKTALSTIRQAVELTPNGHHNEAIYLTNLGNALRSHFEKVGEREDLDAAISTLSQAVELSPDGHPEKPDRLNALGIALQSRYECARGQVDLDDAWDCFVNARVQLSASPSIRFRSARLCVRLLTQYPAIATATSLLEAHSHVLRILPELVWLGQRINRRYEETSKVAEAVNDAVCAAVVHCSLAQAVKWLEAGRSLIWAQILALRSPLDELQPQHRELSESFLSVQRQLQHSDYVFRSSDAYVETGVQNALSSDIHKAIDRHRDLSIQYDGLLSQIRSLDGFEDFLRPKRFSALLPSSELIRGYFVFINVHLTRCDALVLTPNNAVMPVALPELTSQRAMLLQSLWIEQLKSRGTHKRNSEALGAYVSHTKYPQVASDPIDLRHSGRVADGASFDYLLGHMWNWIVGPILRALNLMHTVLLGDPLPHITWCPTGPLTRVPLHAAGIYSEPNGPRVFNYVVSSYAPSLSALVRSSEGIAKQQTFPSVLIVTQSATPGQSPLYGTVDEGRRLKRILDGSQIMYDMLNDKEATQSAVRTVMDRHPWVHFACHGSQHKVDPTKSAFHLYDGPLSLSDLMKTVAKHVYLAFLSACQTATGDANNSEEAVHLAAGMLAVGFKGVVATMWSIGDADAPIVVEAYYRRLLKLRSTGAVGKGETGAAYALHEAVKVLRDHVGERNFLSWAPFVHFGA